MMRKENFILITLSLILFSGCTDTGQNKAIDPDVKRVGMVIRLKEDMIEEYKRLHAEDNKGVRDLLTKYNMRNFNIFLAQLDDGQWYEFGYYEYVGDDFEKDMKQLAAEPRNQAWLELCDPMQMPLEGYNGWAEMERIYFNP